MSKLINLTSNGEVWDWPDCIINTWHMMCMQPWIVWLATLRQLSQTLHSLSLTAGCASCRFWLLVLSEGNFEGVLLLIQFAWTFISVLGCTLFCALFIYSLYCSLICTLSCNPFCDHRQLLIKMDYCSWYGRSLVAYWHWYLDILIEWLTNFWI